MSKKPAPKTFSPKKGKVVEPKLDSRNIFDNPGVKTVYVGGHR